MLLSDRYDSLFNYYGDLNAIDWHFLKTQAQAESGVNLDPNAVSPVGAQGVAQFMAATWREWQDGTPGVQDLPPHELRDPFNPEHAIMAQASLVAWLLRRPNIAGDRRRALGAYNWGYGNLLRCLTAYHARWFEHVPAETRRYVEKIMRSVVV